MFEATGRPDAKDIYGLSEREKTFAVSHDPAEQGEGNSQTHWLELISSGLTFDLTGLAPAPGEAVPVRAHAFDLPATLAEDLEAITLVPGPHLQSSQTILPVIRGLAAMGAALAQAPGAVAAVWHPARCWSSPAFFRRAVTGWLEGGAFPGLGLAGLTSTQDGGLRTEGLALFTGQELTLDPRMTADRAEAAKLALRLMNWLVEAGRIKAPESFTGPSGERLWLQPSLNQSILTVSPS